MLKRIGILFCVFAFLVAGVVFAAPKAGGTLVIGRGGDAVSMDPSLETDGNSLQLADSIFDRLVAYVAEGTAVVPSLAKSWEASPDGKAYTFHLRTGVKFHDGTDFNADAVVFSLARQMKEKKFKFFNAKSVLPTAEQEKGGLFQYWEDQGFADLIDAVEAKDANTVIIKLKSPNASFINTLGMHFCSIVSPTAKLKLGPDFRTQPVGTGPFMYQEWVRGDHITLKKNPTYWDGPAYLDKVIFKVIPEDAVRLLSLQAKDIHINLLPSPESIKKAKADPNLKIESQPGLNIGFLGFNHVQPFFADAKVRIAIAHAINKKSIIDNIYQGTGVVAVNPMPPILWGYNTKIVDYEYNPEMAKKLLAEAKFFDQLKAANKTELTLWCMPVARPYNPKAQQVGEAMQADLKKVGIETKLVTMDWGTYLDKIKKQHDPTCDLFQLGWTGDNGDPDNFLAPNFDGLQSATAPVNWKNKDFHKLIEDGVQITDNKKRVEIYMKAQELFHKEMPAVPVAHAVTNTPMLKTVMDYKNHPFGNCYLHKVWLNQ